MRARGPRDEAMRQQYAGRLKVMGMGDTATRANSPLVDPSRIRCSVGIMAYNEAANIASAIESILRQPSTVFQLHEIIVVASGCTDNTAAIVAELGGTDPRIRLVAQERREGKASAINLFLSQATAPVLIMASADVVLKDGAIDLLLAPFQDETVGMVGAHPVPVNDDQRFMGYTVHLLWDLHDRIARQSPKLGEVVAFRNVVPSIPSDTAVDEISIQALVTQLGYRLVYEPRAIVYNRGPTTVSDFLRQRRRIYGGHLRIQRQQGYSASTMHVGRILLALLASRAYMTPRSAVYALGAVGLEGAARMLGAYDFLTRRQHFLWQIAASTKNQITEVSKATTWQSVLVFHIVDFRQHEIELGARGTQTLVHEITLRMRSLIGVEGVIAPERNGTIIVLVQQDRDTAEQVARALIDDIAKHSFRVNGHPDGESVEVACGIIAFPQAGIALTSSVAVSV